MLKIIYAFFVGLLLTIFVGVGVSAFYPAPQTPEYPAVLETYGKQPTAEQSDAQVDAQREFDRESQLHQVELSQYNRDVSIIVLVAAILFVAVSLLYERRIRVIADGILLGGVFSLVYSIGRSFAAEDSKYTFAVVAVGLVIALFLGYLRFIRPQEDDAKAARASRKVNKTAKTAKSAKPKK